MSLAAIGLVAALAGVYVARTVSQPAVASLESGTSYPAPRPVPPFNLLDTHGAAASPATLRGHPTLVFFGFTHCPDVCPTTLAMLASVQKQVALADKNLAGLRVALITVDPERDTPAALKDYLSSFNPRVMGVGGDAEALAAVAKAYRVYYKKVPLKDGDYTMDHTAIVYLMDKTGAFVAPFSLKRRPEDAAADLRRHF